MDLGTGSARWRQRIRGLRRIAFDTSAIIYFLERVPPYDHLVTEVMELLHVGGLRGTVSTVVEAEALVKPLRNGDWSALERVELFFRWQPNLVVRPVDRAVARQAATVRARAHLALPDAMIVATALEEGCEAIIGNDIKLARRVTELPYLCLEGYLI